MAVFDFNIPNDFIRQIERAEKKSNGIIEKCLEAGGEILYKNVKDNLEWAIGESERSTGELLGSLGVSPVKDSKNGGYNLKIGFNEPRRKKTKTRYGIRIYNEDDTNANAKIANVLEHGRSENGRQHPRPFMKPAVEQSEARIIEAMQKVYEEEADKLL